MPDKSPARKKEFAVDDSHVESYATLINRKIAIPSTSTNYVAVDRHFFNIVMKHIVSLIEVDEAWYRDRNPDISEAVRLGLVRSAQDHYVRYGYFENRLPHSVTVDEDWYVTSYEDVAVAIRNNSYASGQAHFEEVGFSEGRLPYPAFVLRQRDA